MIMPLSRSGAGFWYPVLMLTIFVFRMVDAHAGIIKPPHLEPGAEFRRQCGQQAFGIVKGAPFISQESWKKRSRQCKDRICQGLFVKDQNLAAVPNFAPGAKIPVSIDVQIPHGGVARLLLVDMKNEKTFQSGGKDIVLQDMGRFGTKRKVEIVTATLPTATPKECSEPGRCAISFSWIVNQGESYDICSLITIGK
ncbi:hypothetical protein Pst134EA_020754 [Puccinia striiformis f. sp. tritici]|uniref:hypothetical protein n=1 Tax=Puccinia striiformis f. sp. tritici TaxID=168172 RepID=UPI002007FDC9|nr:hypothetical protein Pst134EA_020754 [Puccinia striiformis f. sp. tritici]KAH9456842.1 hypothetical protein Pst134EA_020754 [Puccinia striiformis f. sp. tritici]